MSSKRPGPDAPSNESGDPVRRRTGSTDTVSSAPAAPRDSDSLDADPLDSVNTNILKMFTHYNKVMDDQPASGPKQRVTQKAFTDQSRKVGVLQFIAHPNIFYTDHTGNKQYYQFTHDMWKKIEYKPPVRGAAPPQFEETQSECAPPTRTPFTPSVFRHENPIILYYRSDHKLKAANLTGEVHTIEQQRVQELQKQLVQYYETGHGIPTIWFDLSNIKIGSRTLDRGGVAFTHTNDKTLRTYNCLVQNAIYLLQRQRTDPFDASMDVTPLIQKMGIMEQYTIWMFYTRPLLYPRTRGSAQTRALQFVDDDHIHDNVYYVGPRAGKDEIAYIRGQFGPMPSVRSVLNHQLQSSGGGGRRVPASGSPNSSNDVHPAPPPLHTHAQHNASVARADRNHNLSMQEISGLIGVHKIDKLGSVVPNDERVVSFENLIKIEDHRIWAYLD